MRYARFDELNSTADVSVMHDCHRTPKMSLHEHTNVTDRSKIILINISEFIGAKLTIWNAKFDENNSYAHKKTSRPLSI